jgi:hypothetical protein
MHPAEVTASGVTPFLTFPLKGGRNLEASLHILVCFLYRRLYTTSPFTLRQAQGERRKLWNRREFNRTC